jgi:hypothetical protein
VEVVKRQRLIAVALTLLFASTARAEPIYYSVSEGQNYEKETWHVGDLKQFNFNRPDNVFDLYTFHGLSGGAAKVVREFSTPSGDWLFILTYYYAKSGQLTKLDSEFRTFGSISVSGEDGLTRCERSYTVNAAGKLHKTRQRITDMKTGRTVNRSFFEPEVKHWMSLRELPVQPH